MQKFNFNKLLDARQKAHKKRMNYLDKYDTTSANKIGNKIERGARYITRKCIQLLTR